MSNDLDANEVAAFCNQERPFGNERGLQASVKLCGVLKLCIFRLVTEFVLCQSGVSLQFDCIPDMTPPALKSLLH
jgi:hypothetical protein